MPKPLLFFSNKLEILFREMAPALFASPFGKKIVVVPSVSMKQWLIEQLVKTPALKLAFGFYPMHLKAAVRTLRELTQDESFSLPSFFQLGWMIQRELEKILDEERGNPLFAEVVSYCQRNRDLKTAELSLEIARLFSEYWENAPVEMVEGLNKDWQMEIWRRLFPVRESAAKLTLSSPAELHLFGISYLSEAEQLQFNRFAEVMPVHYWILSPCRLFWGDLLNKKERVRWIGKTKGHGEEFLQSENDFLSQNGRLGRQWMKRIEFLDGELMEEYWINEKTAQYSSYMDHLLEGVQGEEAPWTLLSALKADLVLLRDPKTEMIEFGPDDSIQVHSAPSALREVEALYQTLVDLLSQSKTLLPREIVVLVSDLAKYEPHIPMVFNGSLKAQIGEGSREDSPLISAFKMLLTLSQSRFDREAVLELCGHPLFLSRQGFTTEEFQHLQELVEEERVSFGIDGVHREAYFGSGKLDEDLEARTWRRAFKNYLDHLAEGQGASFSSAEAIGNWMAVFENLVMAMRPFMQNGIRPLVEWSQTLKQLIETFLDMSQHTEEAHFLIRLLNGLNQPGSCSFSTLLIHLNRELERCGFTFGEAQVQAVRFCSMLPMRAIPAKVVAVLGLTLGSVPKPSRGGSLDRLMDLAPKAERPLPADFDRYLFLESLLSAREKWLLFYSETEESCLPSVMIEELFHYLDAGYCVNGEKPSAALMRRHPLHGFDQIYFRKDSILKNYSSSDFDAAAAYYSPAKSKAEPFIFHQPQELDQNDLTELPEEISLKELKSLLSHPLRTYQKEVLGVSMEKEKAAISGFDDLEEEDYLFQTLQRYALASSVDEALDRAVAEGRFPSGPFKGAALSRQRQKLKSWQKSILHAGASFDVEFVHGFDKVEQVDSSLWRVPAAEVVWMGKRIAITGTLSNVTRKGLICVKENKPEEEIKQMADRWMLHHLPEEIAARKVLFSGKIEEGEIESPNWSALLEHYLRSKKQPAPLMPSWIAPLLEGDEEKLEKVMKESLKPSFFGSIDQPLQWLFRNREMPAPKTVIDLWKQKAEALFKKGDL